MIKFFRKIRQNLLNKNKVGKYLLYAVGEIILVIIGILIALNLNQRSEQKKAEAKIDAIFENILKDLETDINTSARLISNYQAKDSLISIILNTNLTYDDYVNANYDNYSIWKAAYNLAIFTVTDNSYKLLMDNIDAIPEKYNNSVSLLNKLYGSRLRSVEKFNVRLENHVEAFNDIRSEFQWFTESDYRKSKEAISYRLDDYHYKNNVKKYHGIAIRNHRTTMVYYRYDAIKCYNEIASVLNKSLDTLDFILDENILKSYVGTYVSNTNPESKAELSFNTEFGVLELKREKLLDGDDVLLNLSSKTIFTTNNPRGGVFTFSNNDSGEIISMTIHEGHIPVTYTKIKL